ncbi:hypothetical protein, partial [Streptomyces sp. NEAU-H3]|uniref:hypothetical protein n=1 Tax=Streptomyces sp. NEAU-H3 TaxID=2720636 RepID=UPI001ADA9A06
MRCDGLCRLWPLRVVLVRWCGASRLRLPAGPLLPGTVPLARLLGAGLPRRDAGERPGRGVLQVRAAIVLDGRGGGRDGR